MKNILLLAVGLLACGADMPSAPVELPLADARRHCWAGNRPFRVALNPELEASKVGEVDTLTATVYDKCNNVNTSAAMTYTRAPTAKASLSAVGTRKVAVTSLDTGAVYVYAAAGSIKDSSRIDISPSLCLRTVYASNVSTLTTALGSALAGDCIFLTQGTYNLTTALRVTKSGTASQPITIQGAGSATTIINLQQQEMTFEKASYVKLRKMRLTNFSFRGLWLRDSHYNTLDSLEIDNTQNEAVALKNLSSFNVIKNSWIHNTGVTNPQWGEGVYLGGSADPGYVTDGPVTDNQLLNNTIGPNVRSEGLDIKGGADRTLVSGNTFDGTGTANVYTQGSSALIAAISSYNMIENNTLQFGRPNGIVFYAPSTGTMTGNVVQNNSINMTQLQFFTNDPYYGIQLTVNTNQSGRVAVKCNNTVTNGTFSNVACTP